jgi:hypothetical protein
MPATMVSVCNIVIDRSVIAFGPSLSRFDILKEEAYCYAASQPSSSMPLASLFDVWSFEK